MYKTYIETKFSLAKYKKLSSLDGLVFLFQLIVLDVHPTATFSQIGLCVGKWKIRQNSDEEHDNCGFVVTVSLDGVDTRVIYQHSTRIFRWELI